MNLVLYDAAQLSVKTVISFVVLRRLVFISYNGQQLELRT